MSDPTNPFQDRSEVMRAVTAENPNGWPDASKPGVPLEPEVSRFHWVTRGDDGDAFPVEWRAAGVCERGRWSARWIFGDDDHDPATCRYLGPCHTPAEVAALVDAARREEREACARVAEILATGLERNARDYEAGYANGALDTCRAIRARGEGGDA